MDELMLLYTMEVLTPGGADINDAPPAAVGPPDKNSNDTTDGHCGITFLLLFSYLGSSSRISTR